MQCVESKVASDKGRLLIPSLSPSAALTTLLIEKDIITNLTPITN